MGHEVCQTAAAEIPVMPPLVEALRPEGLVGRGAKPTRPIELVPPVMNMVIVYIPYGLKRYL
jgi:hypothetical protein